MIRFLVRLAMVGLLALIAAGMVSALRRSGDRPRPAPAPAPIPSPPLASDPVPPPVAEAGPDDEPEAPEPASEAKPRGPSAEYRESLRRTAERRDARAKSGARKRSEMNARTGQALSDMMENPAGPGGAGPIGPTRTGPRGGVFHIGANGQKVYEGK